MLPKIPPWQEIMPMTRPEDWTGTAAMLKEAHLMCDEIRSMASDIAKMVEGLQAEGPSQDKIKEAEDMMECLSNNAPKE